MIYWGDFVLAEFERAWCRPADKQPNQGVAKGGEGGVLGGTGASSSVVQSVRWVWEAFVRNRPQCNVPPTFVASDRHRY